MDLNQMVVFERVVREGSFTAAAKALGQPKSTVSKRVAELEERLGARLLHRSTRRLKTTEEGAAYYEHCRRIVNDAETADRSLADRDGAPRGLVRITAPTAMATFWSGLAEHVLKKYPDVSLEIALLDRKVDLVAEGFDLALRAGPLRDSSLVTRRLAIAERVLVASPEYLAAHGTPKKPADLRAHECIAQRSDRNTVEWKLENWGRARARIDIDGAKRATDMPAAKRATDTPASKRVTDIAAAKRATDIAAAKRATDIAAKRATDPRAIDTGASERVGRPRQTASVAVGGRYTTSSAQLARDAALAGFGITNLPRFMVAKDLQEKRLVEVLPQWPVRRGEIHLLYPSGQHLSPRVRLLVDLIVERFPRATGSAR